MLEIFVINMCLLQGGVACQQSVNAYYNSVPQIKIFLNEKEKRIKEVAGEEVVFIITPYMAYLRGESLIYSLNKNFQLSIIPREPRFDLKFTITF